MLEARSQHRWVDATDQKFVEGGAGFSGIRVSAKNHGDSLLGVEDFAGQCAYVERFES